MTPEQKEKIILYHCNGYNMQYTAYELKISYYRVRDTVNKFIQQTKQTPNIPFNLQKIREAEDKLIKEAKGIALKSIEYNEKEYQKRLHLLSKAEPNNIKVYV